MSSDAHRIVIIGSFELMDRMNLRTVALETKGMRVSSLLLVDDYGYLGIDKENKKEVILECKNELFDDMYDEELLEIKVKEAYDGKDVVKKLVDYICDHWDEDLQVYFYKPDTNVFTLLKKDVNMINGRVYITRYSTDIYGGDDELQVMENLGIRTSTMLEGSIISKAYFLTMLAEKLCSR